MGRPVERAGVPGVAAAGVLGVVAGARVVAAPEPDGPVDPGTLVPVAGVPVAGARVAALPQPQTTRPVIAATANRAMLRKRRVISGSGNEGRRHGGVVTASLGRDRGTPQGGRSPRSGNAPRPPEPKPRAPADSAGQDMGLSPLGASIWSADDHGYEPEPREPPTVPGPHACAAGPGDSSRNGAVRAGGRRVDRPRPAGARTGTWREMALGSADSRQLRRADRLLSLGQETPA